MTDNEIIKALKDEIRRANYIESYYIDCVDIGVFQNALDLINRQKAEILELQKRIINWSADMDYRPDEIKSEAIKEFAKKLKKRFYLSAGRCVVDVYHIDNLVKEMSEEDI